MLTLVGWFGDHPPGDDAGFLAWTGSLAVPDLHDARSKSARAVSPRSRCTSSRRTARRHYERLARAARRRRRARRRRLQLQPVYGQGMAASALGAAELDACLAERRARGGATRSPGSRASSSAGSRA